LLLISLGCATATGEAKAPTATEMTAPIVVTDEYRHLGDENVLAWGPEDIPVAPQGGTLTQDFEARANEREHTLIVVQRDVHAPWTVRINGTEVASLPTRVPETTLYLPVPAGTLRDGDNRIEISPTDPEDDIAIGPLEIVPRPVREHLRERFGLGRVTVEVQAKGEPMPARISIVDAKGALTELFLASRGQLTVREGLLYTTGGGDDFELPAGDYDVYATRGMEWSLGHARIHVETSEEQSLRFDLTREVDTTGWIAADTHVHTVTHSGHGDATMQERMLTLAGEGIELAVATDHNHNTDYLGPQREMKMTPYFTPVTGNEVTTPIGHFNGFPLRPDDAIPAFDLHDFVAIVDGVRAKGAKVVILNHPHWPELRKGPFGTAGLEPASGRRASQARFTFDAMELVNTNVAEPHPMQPFEDWFGLLNRGERIVAVGASDSHTVGAPVGQGRTYVRSSTDDPAAIDVNQAIDAFLRGDVSVSLGIFADIEVAGEGMGATVRGKPKGTLPVRVRVAAPGWIRPRTVTLFVNGRPVDRRPIESEGATDLWVDMSAPLPDYDAHVVAVVLGDPVVLAGWPTPEAYTLAATNPVWVDVDGKGWSAPRTVAEKRLRRANGNLRRISKLLREADDVIGPQMLDLLEQQILAEQDGDPAWLDRARDFRRSLSGHEHAETK
jgi:hypothetical protein